MHGHNFGLVAFIAGNLNTNSPIDLYRCITEVVIGLRSYNFPWRLWFCILQNSFYKKTTTLVPVSSNRLLDWIHHHHRKSVALPMTEKEQFHFLDSNVSVGHPCQPKPATSYCWSTWTYSNAGKFTKRYKLRCNQMVKGCVSLRRWFRQMDQAISLTELPQRD